MGAGAGAGASADAGTGGGAGASAGKGGEPNSRQQLQREVNFLSKKIGQMQSKFFKWNI